VDQAWKYPPGKALREVGNSGRQVFRLEGPVYTPEAWQTLVICKDWQEARRLAAAGNAVVVCQKDGSLPPGSGKLIAAAINVKTAGFTLEETRRLAWELYPLRLIRTAVTDGTAALKPELKIRSVESVQKQQVQEPEPTKLAQVATEPETEPEPMELPPVQEPGSDPVNRFALECWLNQHHPDLLAAIRAAERECERMDIYYFAGLPDRLTAAEAALAQAVAAGQRAMREALAAGRGEPKQKAVPGEPEVARDPERELGFEEVAVLFGGFERVWRLTAAQAAYLEKIFRWKGPVAVRSENGLWWSAEDWRS
jgi:hypothetical protein